MLQLVAVDANSVQSCEVEHFPFTIGRSAEAGMRIQSPGVWDIHVSITFLNGQFMVRPEGESLLFVNDQPSSGGPLRVGDQMTIGGARVSVSLSSARQYGLKARESLIWVLITVVVLVQFLLLLSIH